MTYATETESVTVIDQYYICYIQYSNHATKVYAEDIEIVSVSSDSHFDNESHVSHEWARNAVADMLTNEKEAFIHGY